MALKSTAAWLSRTIFGFPVLPEVAIRRRSSVGRQSSRVSATSRGPSWFVGAPRGKAWRDASDTSRRIVPCQGGAHIEGMRSSQGWVQAWPKPSPHRNRRPPDHQDAMRNRFTIKPRDIAARHRCCFARAQPGRTRHPHRERSSPERGPQDESGPVRYGGRKIHE